MPLRSLLLALACLSALPATAAVINVSPANGSTAYTLIENANPGDEVVLAPGTYAFRVYLQQQATAAAPIYIHSQDPSNPAVWDMGTTLVDNAPGDYTGGDTARGCWQLSGASNIHIDGVVFQNCHASDGDSAGLRYYNGTTGFLITNCLFQNNDNGLTGGTLGSDGVTQSDATVEFSEFTGNGSSVNSDATHNLYIYGGTFTMRYSYIHDPLLDQNLHCRALTSTIEYNWFSRATSYAGDLMTNDDYANNPVGSITQSMTFRGNVIFQGTTQQNDSQIWVLYNDEASGSPVTFNIDMLYNTLVGAGGHANFLHLSNADGTQMSGMLWDNVISGTSEPVLIEDPDAGVVSGTNNWIQTGASATGLSASIVGSAPGFNAPGSMDYTLMPGSPCIGAANAGVSGLPVDEYYENELVTREYRVRATANDLGAFEHTTSGPGIGPYGVEDGGSGDGGSVTTGGSSSGSSAGTSASSSSASSTESGSSSSGSTTVGNSSGASSTTSHGTSSASGATSTGSSGSATSSSSSGADAGSPSSASGGCGCRTGGAPLDGVVALAALLALLRRRERLAAQPPSRRAALR